MKLWMKGTWIFWVYSEVKTRVRKKEGLVRVKGGCVKERLQVLRSEGRVEGGE